MGYTYDSGDGDHEKQEKIRSKTMETNNALVNGWGMDYSGYISSHKKNIAGRLRDRMSLVTVNRDDYYDEVAELAELEFKAMVAEGEADEADIDIFNNATIYPIF
jgi:hypothetical protein